MSKNKRKTLQKMRQVNHQLDMEAVGLYYLELLKMRMSLPIHN